jgi:hypothetical protein
MTNRLKGQTLFCMLNAGVTGNQCDYQHGPLSHKRRVFLPVPVILTDRKRISALLEPAAV